MKAPEFIAESFAVRTAAHLLHLSSKSYAQHVALGDFYDALIGFVDNYAEVYQGLKGQITRYPAATPDAEDPVELLEEYMDVVDRAESYGSPALENIVAEIEQLTAQTLYKLRFLS